MTRLTLVFLVLRKIKFTEERAMSLENFIITVYCLIDGAVKKIVEEQKLRQRGFESHLSASEMITMEIVAEF
jgi:hypothetical protein